MAKAIITLKVMPETADVNIDELEKKVVDIINGMEAKVGKTEQEPIAFGLKSLKVMFVADENLGTEEFEQAISKLEEVQTAQIVDFRRALG